MPAADLASSFNSFFNASSAFFAHLSDIRWTPFAIALGFLLAMQLCRAWAWRNVLRAAYPDERISFTAPRRRLPGGSGDQRDHPRPRGRRHQGLPGQAPDPPLLLPGGHLVLPRPDRLRHHASGSWSSLYAITQGLLPPLPRAARPAGLRDLLLGRTTRKTLLIVTGALLLAIAIGIYYLAHHVRRFWDRVKQGLVILGQPRRYLREVAAWQGIGWLCRFAAFWFFLEAFGIGGSVGNVMLVMSVQAIANIVPFTPGGAGAQQALLVATLKGPSRSAVLSFSVGTQIAMAAWSVVLGFAAILLVFGTTDWKGLIRQAQDEADAEAATLRPQSPE